MVVYCLTNLDEPAMWSLAAVLYACPKPFEKAFLAVAAIAALDEDEWQHVLNCVEGRT
jgi:hypothetical protein